MNTTTSQQPKFKDLIERITARVEELALATDAARMSEDMLRYLDSISRFHRYSLYNSWLILMAFPNATQVAGFHQWNSYNRFVKKGEKGIPILAPIWVSKETQEKDEDRMTLRGFKICYVFDVSQTDGEPLPEPPDWKKPEKNSFLAEHLMAFAREKGITITEKELEGEIQGVSKGGCIEIDPSAGTSTIIHELAHEIMLHHGSDLPICVKELEAESTAFVVCRHFGLQSTCSPNYVALHGATSDMIMEHLERIRVAAMEIIQYVEQSLAAFSSTQRQVAEVQEAL